MDNAQHRLLWIMA